MQVGEMLTEFHEKFNSFGLRYIDFTKADDTETNEALQLRWRLITEEYKELAQAIAAAEKDLDNKEKLAEILKETCDCVYVLVGFIEKLGWDFDEAFRRVHASNMSKVGDDGKPVYREDGKIIKTKHYVPPQMLDLVEPKQPVPEPVLQVTHVKEDGSKVWRFDDMGEKS